MSLLVFNLTRLPTPFESINESVFEIPASGSVRVLNRLPRVLFVLDGEAKLVLGNKSVDLRAGDIFVVPNVSQYAYLPHWAGRSSRLHVLVIALRKEVDKASLPAMVAARFPDVTHLPAIQNASTLHYIHQLRAEAESNRRDKGIAVGALSTLLLLGFLRASAEPLPELPRTTRSSAYLVEQAREFVFKNYGEELSLGRIAWHLRLSEEYLARLFKRETGGTVFSYVREVRLNVAKNLLTGTNQSVAKIGEKAGFASPSVFCRLFRKEFGLSPSAYRSKHAGNPGGNLSPREEMSTRVKRG